MLNSSNPKEKKQYQEAFINKVENLAENHPERYKKLLPELRKLFIKKTKTNINDKVGA